MTNGDSIRRMSDEELSILLAALEAKCYARMGYESDLDRFAAQYLDWLEQEVESDA